MNFSFTDVAKNYIKKQNIEDLYISIDINSKAACCGVGTVDLLVTRDKKGSYDHFHQASLGELTIHYDPNLAYYFNDESSINIAAFGIGRFKTLFVTNEINVFSDKINDPKPLE